MPRGPRLRAGIGSTRRSAFVGDRTYDCAYLISSAEAVATARQLLEETGLSVGGSSGAVVAACVRHLARATSLEVPVCVCANSGDPYRQTIFDDAWVQAHGVPAEVEGLDALRRMRTRFTRSSAAA